MIKKLIANQIIARVIADRVSTGFCMQDRYASSEIAAARVIVRWVSEN